MGNKFSTFGSSGMGSLKNMPSGNSSEDEDEEQEANLSIASLGATSVNYLGPSGSRQNAQEISSFKFDPIKHKMFLSHAGAQKNFVDQLCVDLERRGYLFPFFDQRSHSLPKGRDFAPLIFAAAQQCRVAVILLSKEFLSKKWPMMELTAFHAAQQQPGETELYMFPLFFELVVEDLDDQCIKDRWMPKWKEHALKDKRIDVHKWSAAVKALRKVNGQNFDLGISEVCYRTAIVRSIFALSPPDFLNNTSKTVVGYNRLCEVVSAQFVKDNRIEAQVLGLYGMGGRGKTIMCRALCNYFHRDFLGRVCHVTLGKGSVIQILERQKLVLEKLCGFEKDMLDKVRDVGEGWTLMQDYMKREPVFLVLDNVIDDKNSWEEALAYLMVGFHPGSRIMVTSRSKDVVQELLPSFEFCTPLPNLTKEEAGTIFLKSAAPWKAMLSLTDEERAILGLCLEQCLFDSDAAQKKESTSYHPLALEALGSFFYRINNTLMLPWKKFLEDNKDPLKLIWKSSKYL